ncbi:MAG: hypothetical protein ACPLX7_02725 [Candidatus Kapaibacteriota bacterium]|jgi:hypothetical protein
MFLKYFRYFVYSFLLVVVSCEVSNEDRTARLVPFRDFFNLVPGFEWFNYEYDKYKPDTNVTRQIDSLWKIKQYRFLIFANPSCNCDGTQSIFPMVAKSLKTANIPDSVIIVYTMLNASYSHPFMHKFVLKRLPSCFTEIDSSRSLYYSVVDTFEMYKLKSPGKFSMEQIILMSLGN